MAFKSGAMASSDGSAGRITVKFLALSSTLGGVPVVGTKRPYLFPASVEVESKTRWGDLVRQILNENIELRHGPMLSHAFCVDGQNLNQRLTTSITKDSVVHLIGMVPRTKQLTEAYTNFDRQYRLSPPPPPPLVSTPTPTPTAAT
jgi:hypothetical protein